MTYNIITDSTGKQYKKSESGTCYSIETSDQVISVLDSLNRGTRVRVWYGKDGISWDEENDACGYIGRSTGIVKIPLLVNNNRSLGGGALLDSSIIKIVRTEDKRTLYAHPNFKQSIFNVIVGSDLKEYAANVNKDGVLYARCKTLKQAEKLAQFMNGERMSK